MAEHYCDKCKKKRKFVYYHGLLGYESFECAVCHRDINDILEDKIKKIAKGR
jgi:hypothetical protein